MSHEFDPGYNRNPFSKLCRQYPGADVYPVEDFRVEWGPIFHRGRLDGSARIVVIGQDPAAHESIARRILVGEAGQRVQGLLWKLGFERNYVMVNTFLYSVYGQGGGERHKDDPAIAEYRNKWLDALVLNGHVEAVISLGGLADHAFNAWLATPNGKTADVAYQTVRHPTYPERASASGQLTKAEAMADMLETWNHALRALHKVIDHPDVDRPIHAYGASLLDTDVFEIPERDMPAGTPDWMRSIKSWGRRTGTDANDKRATVEVKVPTQFRTWE